MFSFVFLGGPPGFSLLRSYGPPGPNGRQEDPEAKKTQEDAGGPKKAKGSQEDPKGPMGAKQDPMSTSQGPGGCRRVQEPRGVQNFSKGYEEPMPDLNRA